MRRRRLLLPLHTIRESTRNIFKFRSSINHKIVVKLFCQMARSVFLFIFCSDDVVFTVIFHIHILSLITIRIMRWNIFSFNFEHSTFLCFLSQFRSVLKKAVLFPRVSCFIACSVKIFKWRKLWYLLEYPCIRWYSVVGQARSRLVRFYLTCLEGGGREGEEERHIAQLLHKWGLLETQAAGPQAAGFSNLLTKVNSLKYYLKPWNGH